MSLFVLIDNPTPPPAQKKSGFAKAANMVIFIVMIVVAVMIFFGQKIMMGKRYKVSDTKSVNYSEKATQEDAKKVGEALKGDGYFSGKNHADVLLKKGNKEGTVLSFVGTWNWKVLRPRVQSGHTSSARNEEKVVASE